MQAALMRNQPRTVMVNTWFNDGRCFIKDGIMRASYAIINPVWVIETKGFQLVTCAEKTKHCNHLGC